MFKDSMKQGDAVSVVLNCGFCNKPAEAGHRCSEMEKQQCEKEKREEPNSET